MSNSNSIASPKRKLTKKEKLRNKKNKKYFSKKDLEIIEAMAQVGHTQAGIGKFIGCCGETIRNNKVAHAAWKIGRDLAKSQVSNAHFHCAKRKSSENFQERKLFMQLQMGYGEVTQSAAIDKDCANSEQYELAVENMTDEELIRLEELMSKYLRKKETVSVKDKI